MKTLAPSPALIEDLVDANHILAHEGVFDAFGHVSARHPGDSTRFLLSRNLAPALVSAADIVEYRVDDAEAVAADAPRGYLERYIHSEIYRARPDVQAVVHHHSPAVIPFGVAAGVRLRPVCHMSGFLGDGPPLFEMRDHFGAATDLLIRHREAGAALAATLGSGRVVLMRGHGCTLVAPNLRLAVYRSIYTELNAKLLQQALALGTVTCLSAEEGEATVESIEGQVDRPWSLWRARARLAG